MTSQFDSIVDDIASNCLAVQTRITSRDVTRLYDEHLRPLGLRITQLSVLVAIGVMRDAIPSSIGAELHLDKSTLSRTLAILRQNGWIDEVESDDARSKPVRLSITGRKLVARAYPIWSDAQKAATELLRNASPT